MPAVSRRGFLAGVAALAVRPVAAADRGCQVVRLPDGRRLAYAEWGDPAGRPVVYHHGFPTCRLEAEILRPAVACRPGVRLIAFDRPGIGYSDPRLGETLCHWPADLAAALAALGIDRFGLIGVSGGTPCAVAAAAHFGPALTGVVIASGVADLCGWTELTTAMRYMQLCDRQPAVGRAGLNALARSLHRRPTNFTRLLGRELTPQEVADFSQPENAAQVARAISECVRQSAAPMAAEMARMCHPWLDRAAGVSQPVTMFHGAEDGWCPPAFTARLAARLPRAEFRVIPGEGHLSVVANQGVAILDAAVGPA